LNDPFAADPPLSLDEDEMLRVARDPFADDPDFGLELDASLGDNTAIATISEDPEYTLEIDDSQVAGDEDITDIPQSLGSEAESAVLSEQVPFDPFAEDTSFLENEVVVPEDTIAAVVDPFAEDPSVEDGLEIATVESAEIAQSELQQLDRAKDVAESLLLPKTDEQTRREYVCCAFELCGRSYYLPIKHMVEISDQQPLLPLPLAPAVVKGLINLRGQVIPVIDLSVLHRGPAESVQIRRLVVAEHKKEKLAFLAEGIPYLSEVQVGEKIDLPKFLSKYRIRGAGA